jgi:hypothetical protein
MPCKYPTVRHQNGATSTLKSANNFRILYRASITVLHRVDIRQRAIAMVRRQRPYQEQL